jgi:hypothetical protein
MIMEKTGRQIIRFGSRISSRAPEDAAEFGQQAAQNSRQFMVLPARARGHILQEVDVYLLLGNRIKARFDRRTEIREAAGHFRRPGHGGAPIHLSGVSRPILKTECHLADAGVGAIGANDEIVAFPGPVGESDVDAVIVLSQHQHGCAEADWNADTTELCREHFVHGVTHDANCSRIVRSQQPRQFDRSGHVSFGIAGLEEGLREPAGNASIQNANFTQRAQCGSLQRNSGTEFGQRRPDFDDVAGDARTL